MSRVVHIDDGHILDWTLTEEPGDDHVFTKLNGWFGAPTRLNKTELWQDGTYTDPLWRNGRELTIAGFHRLRCHPDPMGERERLKRAISGAFRSGASSPGVVRVTDPAGVTLEAVGVQLDGQPLFTDHGRDLLAWELPLYVGDPYLYEVGFRDLSVSPSGEGSGLEYPLFDDEDTGTTTGFLEWSGESLGAAGVAMNLGNATAYPQIIVTGLFPSGFQLTLTGDKDLTVDPETRWGVTYLGSVDPASPVTVDMGGRISIDGIDRSWALVDPYWGGVEPGGQVTFSIDPISVGTGTAQLILRSTYL